MPHSDKSIKIYNEINFIHNIDKKLAEDITLNLTLKNKSKIKWIFKAIKISDDDFSSSVIDVSKQNNSLNILLFLNNFSQKKMDFLKIIMKNYGKKLIIISSKSNSIEKDESIFYCKIDKNLRNIENKILKTITLI